MKQNEALPLIRIQQELLELAIAYKSTYDQLGDKFRNMVAFIRANQMTPEQVIPVLIKAGFNKNRVSEMRSIAELPDPRWQAYQDGEIGWRAALEESRAPRKKPDSKPARRAWPKFLDAFTKAVKKNPKLNGSHVYYKTLLIVAPLFEGTQEFAQGEFTVHVKISSSKKG